jgi:hypothetical protein
LGSSMRKIAAMVRAEPVNACSARAASSPRLARGSPADPRAP